MIGNTKFLFFLFGLGGQLQLFGTSLSFSELFVFAAAPILTASEWPHLRRNGLLPFFGLSMMVVLGGMVSCIANRSPMFAVVRGMAVVCLMPCTIVVCHWMLRKSMSGFRWWLVGFAISGFVCTFAFQNAVEVTALSGGVADKSTADAIMSGPIYWITRLNPLLMIPAKGWYLQCPTLYCIGAPLFMAGFAMLTTTSGRSAALSALSMAALVFLGGKHKRTMRLLGRWFWGLVVAAIIGAFVAKDIYRYAALNDWLGEAARMKYEHQTKGKTGMMALLLGGRMGSFGGLMACVDKPIVGFGPWALDYEGYTAEFLAKYADYEDVQSYYKDQQLHPESIRLIPCHAIITQFWLWYGIFGLFFWLYVIFVLLRYIRQDCWAVPQWYMWLAASVPGVFWSIFFSPYSKRIGMIMFVVACLMVRAVRKGRQTLPVEMLDEIKRANC